MYLSGFLVKTALYGFYKIITIQNSQVVGSVSHADFPVLISHIDADIRSTGNGGMVENVNGYDIRFTAADGITLLDPIPVLSIIV